MPLQLIFIFMFFSFVFSQQCRPGRGLINGTCTICPPGTYSDARTNVCGLCPPGFFNSKKGVIGINGCFLQPCRAGSFNPTPGAVSALACRPCPLGKASLKGYSECLTCPPGTHLGDVVQSRSEPMCVDCFSFEFSDMKNSVKCKTCYGDLNEDRSKCDNCQKGFGGNGNGQCEKCRTGYNDGSSTACMDCPAGFTGASPIADHCVPCPAGKYKVRLAGSCLKCPRKVKSSAIGATVCIPDGVPCPFQYFRNFRGACQTCLKSERFDEKKQRCVPCGENEGSLGGMTAFCEKCSADRFATADGCVCRLGYKTVELSDGSEVCDMCPPGTSGRKKDRRPAFCQQCSSSGTVAEKAGSLVCKKCPAKSLPNEDNSGCVQCPRGTVVGIVFFEKTCVLKTTGCPPGFDQLLRRGGIQSGCSAHPSSCPKGTVWGRVSRRSGYACFVISPGFVLRKEEGGSFAKACEDDEVSDGGATAVCRKCPEGKFRDENDGSKCGCRRGSGRYGGPPYRGWIEGRCETCPAGTRGGATGLDGEPICISCPVGFSSSRVGGGRCVRCKAGTFADKRGMVICEPCPRGTTTYGIGEARCVPLR